MKNIKKIPIILSILSLLTSFSSANAETKVVASIKPIHSLASYLMDGIGKPDLIVDGYASPHGFALKPSHAKMLQEADIVFWVGEDLENFLEKPLGSIAKKAEKIELLEIKGLTKLKFRERNIFDEHDHAYARMLLKFEMLFHQTKLYIHYFLLHLKVSLNNKHDHLNKLRDQLLSSPYANHERLIIFHNSKYQIFF